DSLFVGNNAVVTLSSAAGATLRLEAGENLVFDTGRVATAGGGIHTVELAAGREGDGGVSQSAAPTSGTTNVLAVPAGGGGTPVQAFAFDADRLSVDTAGLGGSQFLAEANAVSVTALNAGPGTISLAGGTFVLAGGGSISDPSLVVMSSSAVLDLN